MDKLSDIEADIKLDGTESTNFKENIQLQLPAAASSLKNITWSPEQVTVEVTISQDLQQKTVVVKPDLQGSMDLVTMSKKLLVTPATVIIQGKEDVLNNVDSISTEPVSLDTLKNSTIPIKAKLILPQDISFPDSQPNAVLISLTAP